MTRLSHSNLELVRANPGAFTGLASRRFNGPSRFKYVVLATKHLHESGLQAGLNYIESGFAKRGFRMENLPKYHEYLADYEASYASSGYALHTRNWRMNVFAAAGLELRGEVARLDITSGGYAAWLFKEEFIPKWEDELRMPIIQRAIAQEMQAPESEVSVGFYFFGPAEHESRVYTSREIAAAYRELRRVGRSIAGL